MISNSDTNFGIGYKRRMIGLVFLFLLMVVASPLQASSLHLNTTSLGQVRENTNSQKEIPVSGYFGLRGTNTRENFSAATNMRIFRDFNQKLDDYDLYQAVIDYKPAETVDLRSGRQLINHGFSLEMLDGIQTTMGPFGHFDFSLYSGVPRNVERGDINKNDGLLTGLSLGLKKFDKTDAGIHAAWRKNDIYQTHWKQNDEMSIGASFSHQFSIKTEPFVYSVAEYDASGKILNTGEVGVDLTPSRRVLLNLEMSYSDISRQTDRLTIQRVFSDGRIWIGRFASTWTLVPKFIDLVESYSYQNMTARGGSKENGHLIDSSLQISVDALGLHLEPGYTFSKSFGGTLHGVRGLIHEQWTQKFYTDLAGDYTTYNKITNDNDKATSTGGWVGYEFLNGLTVSGGFEYNKNNFFNKDARGSFRIDYHFDHEG